MYSTKDLMTQIVIGHFRVPEFHFQHEAKCKTFPVKMSFICMTIKNHVHINSATSFPGGERTWERGWSIVSHLASVWNRGLEQIGDGLFLNWYSEGFLSTELFEGGNNSQTSRAKPRIKSSPVSPPMEVTLFGEEIRLLRTFQCEVERIGVHFVISESSEDCEETLVFVHRVPSVLVEREVSEVKRGRPSVAVSKVKVIAFVRTQPNLVFLWH